MDNLSSDVHNKNLIINQHTKLNLPAKDKCLNIIIDMDHGYDDTIKQLTKLLKNII